ncbi:RING-H2 finger protein ATL14 [Raphanus sativus]|uniref:RING-type E3 ubiquitin transferase n=1 Tax=Raphanus sativus TaxID=3726 RepID=A0A6J0KPC3_RAPSA|nr:RING-H2 finger protein ATL14 [Raphanus sativus]
MVILLSKDKIFISRRDLPMSMSILHDEPITGDQSAPPPKRHATSLSTKILSKILVGLIMIPVAATALLFILMSLSFSLFFFSLYWFLHRNYRRRESSDGLLSPRCVESLPQFKFYEQTLSVSECVVCIDGFRRGQWCRKLPGCGHVFHRKCVDFWLVKVATCPICRDRVIE